MRWDTELLWRRNFEKISSLFDETWYLIARTCTSTRLAIQTTDYVVVAGNPGSWRQI
jgi:hypothetical protein